MKRILKSIGFGILATAVMGAIGALLMAIFNWLINLAPNVLPYVLVALFGIIIFGGIAYQDLFKE